ncbi:MAG TPA: hypothetical protein VK936_02580, partial [Longimicrobiales bacterium]|nr:hypothetical protein [Longimicrobiales bacterium]
MRKLLAVQLATMLAMAATACTDTPLEMAEDEGFAEIVVTHGAPLPPQGQSDPGVPSMSTVAVDALVTGSSTSPVS